MSKAIVGAVELAGAAVLAFTPGLNVLGTPWLMGLMFSLASGGVASEAGAIAQALTANRGMGVTTRQPAAFRQIIRGTQRVPGTIVYQSSTGSTHRQFNMVIVLATHEIDSILGLYLDGREVFWQNGSSGNSTRNGVNFGGTADPGNFIGPNGVHYTFGSEVYCQAYYGDQNASSGFCAALQANDATWSPSNTAGSQAASGHAFFDPITGVISSLVLDRTGVYPDGDYYFSIVDANGPGSGAGGHLHVSSGTPSLILDSGGSGYVAPQFAIPPSSYSSVTPYLGGCAYVYLKLEADSATFPQFPEIRFTIKGKNDILDPRTGLTGYTENWALQIADMITDIKWGVGDQVNTDQLIAAANVCDEMVACAAGSERRYSMHWHYDTSVSPADAIAQMLDGAAGRMSYVGGEWFIYPAYWQGPSAIFGADDVCGPIQWTPKRALSELCNRVSGTYTAPNYPYNLVGDLYDSNGYWNGETQNNFPFAFQPSNFPMYACDALHGYGTGVDVYLTEDGGIYLPKEVGLPGVLSIAQAQRIAKIMLLRNRQQGSGMLPMKISALSLQPLDVMGFNFSQLGWSGKVLEVAGVPGQELKIRYGVLDGDDAPSFTLMVPVNETDASVYEWNPAEELSPYDVPVQAAGSNTWIVAPPSGVAASSDLTTAIVQPDGSLIPRLKLAWTEPADTYVTNGGLMQVQICATGTAAWQDAAVVSGQATQVFLTGVVAGLAYDVRVRSKRSNGAASAWVEIDGTVIGSTPGASPYLGQPLAQGALIALALSGGGAEILVEPFTATVGTQSASCLSAGEFTISSLTQDQRYWVYYYDATFSGGAITPIATQNTADFVGKPGYYYIGTVITPKASGGGGSVTVLRPSSWSDNGTRTTQTPGDAFDADPLTYAGLTAQNTVVSGQTNSDCMWTGFGSVVTSAAMTLTVVASLSVPASSNPSEITLSIGGTATTLFSASVTTAGASYTATIPSGTNLGTVNVEASAGPQLATSGGTTVRLSIYDINIQ